MGATTITMNGVEVGIRFSSYGLRQFAAALEKNQDLYLITGELKDGEVSGGRKVDFTIEGLAKFIQCGYLNYCMVKEIEPALTYEDFFNYAEDARDNEDRLKEITSVLECFSETRYAKRLKEVSESV